MHGSFVSHSRVRHSLAAVDEDGAPRVSVTGVKDATPGTEHRCQDVAIPGRRLVAGRGADVEEVHVLESLGLQGAVQDEARHMRWGLVGPRLNVNAPSLGEGDSSMGQEISTSNSGEA